MATRSFPFSTLINKQTSVFPEFARRLRGPFDTTESVEPPRPEAGSGE